MAVSGYHVYRDGGTSPIATVTTPGYTDTGLAPGSTHSYTVDAFDAVPNTSTDKITLTGLSGATTTNQRSLRAGIDHYDGTSTSPVTVTHGSVAASQTTWLGP